MKDKNLNKSTEYDIQKSEINHKKLKAVLIGTGIIGVVIAVGIVVSLLFLNNPDLSIGGSGTSILPNLEHESYSSNKDGSLKLNGIVFTDSADSYAVVLYEDNTFIVAENEEIGASGWTVKEIRENEIVLTGKKGDKILDFSDNFGN